MAKQAFSHDKANKMSLVVRKQTFWFPTWSNTNQAVQLQRMARSLKFRIYEVEGLYYSCSEKTKALISFVVNAKLICVFVFAYAKSRFSHDAAHMAKQVFSRDKANKMFVQDLEFVQFFRL